MNKYQVERQTDRILSEQARPCQLVPEVSFGLQPLGQYP